MIRFDAVQAHDQHRDAMPEPIRAVHLATRQAELFPPHAAAASRWWRGAQPASTTGTQRVNRGVQPIPLTRMVDSGDRRADRDAADQYWTEHDGEEGSGQAHAHR